MSAVRTFSIITWILLPTVMFGGYSLLRLMNTEELSEFQLTFFRAGHAHAGVLLVMALVYYSYLARTEVGETFELWACILLMLGTLAQSGGFFLHMAVGEEGSGSIGTTVTTVGALVLVVAVGMLVYALITTPGAPFAAARGTDAPRVTAPTEPR